MAPEFAGSVYRTVAGGELTPQARDRARTAADNWRKTIAKHGGTPYEPLPPPADNMLGDLDLGLDHLITQTEIEIEAQLPTCERMKADKTKMLHPDTSYTNIRVHHWIKIVMRLSRLDPDDPKGLKRRHFEISIDSPFHIVSCLATQSHISLPTYSSDCPAPSMTYKCGCPNAPATGISPASSTQSIGSDLAIGPDGAAIPDIGLAVPAQAHTAHDGTRPEGPGAQPAGVAANAPVPARPMHLLRVPSYNPPAFSADDPPPALETPPPLYDHIIGTPSVDGLADYFARLADEYDDDDSEEDRVVSRGGAVNVRNPMTPGGRNTSRSMDLHRGSSGGFTFNPQAFDPRLTRERATEAEEQSRSSTPRNGGA